MAKRLWILAGCVVLAIGAYMLLGVRGSWAFAMELRSEKLAGLLIVSVAISTATLLFHTVTGNRILTPSLIGFDALYVMLLSMGVFALGAQSYIALPDGVLFLGNAAVLALAAVGLFLPLLRPGADLMRLVLTGIILGVLFRSFSSLIQRMIDPNEYAVIAANSFASFTSINRDLLGVSALISGVVLWVTWRMRHRLDVLALGRDAAINLGLNHRQQTLRVMVLIAVLVSISTALVGPVAFLGLLVVNLAYGITPTHRHEVLLISSALVCATTLIGGQAIMERVLGFATPLSVVIDFIGGIAFLLLIFYRRPG